MYKLEKQIIEMENFASHLEEVFITVEVSAHCRALQTHLLPSVAGAAAACSVRQRILEHVASLLPFSTQPSPPSHSTLGIYLTEPVTCQLSLQNHRLSGGRLCLCVVTSPVLLQSGTLMGHCSTALQDPHLVIDEYSFSQLLPVSHKINKFPFLSPNTSQSPGCAP